MKPESKRILIDVLCGHERGDWINPKLVSRLFEAIGDCMAWRHHLSCNVTQGFKPVSNARNHIVKRFLATDSAWLIMCDNDIVPPEHFVRVIEAAEEDGRFVVGLPCPIIHGNSVVLNVAHKTDNQHISAFPMNSLPGGWATVDYVGTGLIAIRRCVLETIKAPWFEEMPTMGEDFNFCRKAQIAGFQVWTHGSFVCDHLHTFSLLGALGAQLAPGTFYTQE